MKKMVIRALCFVPCALCLLLGAGAAALPAGYTQVEYIESTSGGGQYINTGYTPHKDTEVVCRILDNGTDTTKDYGALFGSRFGYLQDRGMFLWLRYWGKNAPSYGRAGGESSLEESDFPFGEITTVTCQGATCSWITDAGTKPNSITVTNCKENQYDGFGPMLIFAINSTGEEGGCYPTDHLGFRLYSFTIYEGFVLKRDFVPCIETSSGRAGLWDKVEGKFYGNAGSGAFLVGLPLGYTRVEYIESTSGGGQYINTGYTPHKDTKVVFRMLDNGTDTSKPWGAAFGSRFDFGWTRSMYLWLRRDGWTKPSYGRAGDEGPSDKSNFPFGEITTVTCQGPTCSWVNDAGTKANGITLVNCIAGQEEGYAPMLIFAINSPNVEGGCNPTDWWGFRLYSFKIYEGNVLKHDFVPCISVTG